MSVPDRWALTVNALQGQPWPELPPLPGRRHVAHDEPLTDAEREELLRDDSATAERSEGAPLLV